MHPGSSPSLYSLRSWWLWLIIFSPAAFLLSEMVPLLVPVPCLDSWSFVQQYRELMEDRYSWERFFAPNYAHPSAVGKAIYFGVLRFLGGNVVVLPVLSWLFSVVIAVCVYRLARPQWDDARWLPTGILCCVTLIIFTAAQGEVWLWDFVFQNFIPGVCLAVGLWLLLTGGLSAWRLVVAAVLSVISIHSFATGYLVPVLFSLAIWRGMRGRSTVSKICFVGAWLFAHGVIAWLALTAPGASDAEEGVPVSALLDRPLMRVHFLLIILGNILGKGTVFEPSTLCAVLGGALLLVFVGCMAFVWRRRNDREFTTAALPWMAFALYGLGSAVLITLGRMQNSLDNALDERFGTFTVFFVFGTFLLAATVLRQMAAAGSSWFPAVRRVVGPAFAILLAALLINWGLGLNLMRIKHSRMDQERALLTFARVMPLENNEWMLARITRKSSFGLSIFLADHGLLNGVQFAKDRNIESFKRGKKLGGKWARLDAPVALGDGRWQLTGMGGLSVDNVADLILITAQGATGPEEIVGLAATLMRTNFFDRQKEVRSNPQYYLGWSHTLNEKALPAGPITMRAYVLDQDKRVVHPIEGIHRLRDPEAKASIGVHKPPGDTPKALR